MTRRCTSTPYAPLVVQACIKGPIDEYLYLIGKRESRKIVGGSQIWVHLPQSYEIFISTVLFMQNRFRLLIIIITLRIANDFSHDIRGRDILSLGLRRSWICES
jgi:hypothetical protein